MVFFMGAKGLEPMTSRMWTVRFNPSYHHLILYKIVRKKYIIFKKYALLIFFSCERWIGGLVAKNTIL